LKESKIYLQNTPLDEAQTRFFEQVKNIYPGKNSRVEVETVKSAGRITAEPVLAGLSSPHYFASAMDGVAVPAEQTFGAAETSPKILNVGENCYFVDTGDPLPENCNAVIMIEHVNKISPNQVEIYAAAAPWQHVRPVGEDILAGELVLPVFHKIGPVETGLLLSAGVNSLAVLRKPRVIIIPTGSELVEPGKTPGKGEIIDSNSSLFTALVEEWGGEAVIYPVTEDDYYKISETVLKASEEADLVLISAGSSAGGEDYTSRVVEEQGELFVHGVAIRPGKPVVLGRVKEAAIAGIPGYPVSAYLAMDLFVKPLLHLWLGQQPAHKPVMDAIISRKVVSSLKDEEYLRVVAGNVEGKNTAVPLQRGAGVLSSVLKADGWVRIPQSVEGLEAGTSVQIMLNKTPEEVYRNILCAGSHDLCLDILHNSLCRLQPGLSLKSAHLGSVGGIMSIKRKEAHLAPIHLLDPESGIYNIPYIKRYLPNQDLVLLHLLYREQGLILPQGNPQNIDSIEDLTREGLQFINRQKGAGTRILLDYELDRKGINKDDITGYHREEYNHLAVAAAVASGSAGAGLGILAAARAYQLDFVPLAKESYEIIIPRAILDQEGISRLLEVISSAEFAREVEKMGGYDLRHRGKVVWESG